MFRKTIVLFVVFFVGINASEDSDFQWKSSLDRETNGDISIISMHNTNNEIAHRPIEYVEMELIEAVNGILHYTFGARVRSEYMMFNYFHGPIHSHFVVSTNFIFNFIRKEKSI